MALDSNDTERVYDLFGLSAQAGQYYVYAVVSQFGAFVETYSYSTIKTELDTRLAAISAEAETHIEAAVDRYEAITPWGNKKIHTTADGAQGRIVDDVDEVEKIRQYVARKNGFRVPKGGWLTEKPDVGGRMIR